MIGVPVERIGLHLEIVARKIAGRIAQVVKLVPEQALLTRRFRNDSNANEELESTARYRAALVDRRLDLERHSTLDHPAELDRRLAHRHSDGQIA